MTSRFHSGADKPPVVRLGATVRRPSTANTPLVRDVLRWLADVRAADYVPEVRGADGQGRQVLGFVEGEPTWVHHHEFWGSDAAIAAAGALVRRFHDDTASYRQEKQRERGSLCHGDLGPWNVVQSPHGRLVIIDWDGLGPGDAISEAAFAAWAFVPLMGTNETGNIGWRQAPNHGPRLANFLTGYRLAVEELQNFFGALRALPLGATGSLAAIANHAFVQTHVDEWESEVRRRLSS